MLRPISQSNLANFGTELEYKIKQAAAKSEPAFAQFLDGVAEGTYLWVVHDFKLEPVKVSHDVTFYSGDSYLVFHVEGTVPEQVYRIYYWIGSETTADEAGTAAYKAFELDNVFNGTAIQYREVCGSESVQFRELFTSFKIVGGGFDSGFHHVEEPAQFQPRLYRVTDGKEEAHLPLDEDGAYILDLGKVVFQWVGSTNPKVKYATMQEVRALDESRDSAVAINVLESMSEFECIVSSIYPTKSKSRVPRITVWDGEKFRETDAIHIDPAVVSIEYDDTCTVYGKLPFASICVMAFFNWAKIKPVTTRFVAV